TLILLIVLAGPFCNFLFAQDQPDSKTIDKARLENLLVPNRAQRLLFIPTKISSSVQVQMSSMPSRPNSQSSSQTTQNNNCADSSFKKLFETLDRSYSFLCSIKTKDGGIVIGGFGRSKLEGPPNKWYSIVSKFDSVGNHLWSREIRSDVQTTLYIESMSELSDGAILVSGWHENVLSITPPTPGIDFFIAKLTSAGGLIWLNTFHSLLGNGCTTSNIRFASMAEGANGDIYVAGTAPNCPDPTYFVVFKINGAGILQWK